MKLVVPGVYTFTGLMVGRVYLLVEDDGLTLIDASLDTAADRIARQITGAGYTLTDVKRILITHGHFDHVGGVPRLKELTGAEVLIPVGERPHLEDCVPFPMPDMATLPGIWRYVRVPRAPLSPIPFDDVIQDGDVLDIMGGLHVLSTPGHSPGHVSFWQPERRILFCGDVMMRFLGPNLRVPFVFVSPDMAENTRAVGRLAALEPETLCMGHGQPILRGAAPLVRAHAASLSVL